MKTFDRKDMFTIATIENARKYINCEGYFCDSFYENLNKCRKGILKEVNEYSTDYPFIELNTKGGLSIGFRFFLPVDKVRKEKKWRAYKNVNEFDYAVGDTIHLRLKHKPSSEYIYLITGFNLKENSISINGVTGNFENFFDLYEIFNGKDWQPFGVQE